MRPRISIIIPVYNSELYLPQCLESILEQTFQDYEVIMVDDGSSDLSGSICDEYAEKDERFHCIHQKNNGVSSARNAGLDAATGEMITFVDSDDWMNVKGLEQLYSTCKETGADLIIGNMSFVYRNKTEKEIHIFGREFLTSDKNWIAEYGRACIGYGYNPTPGSSRTPVGLGSMGNKLYKRSIIEQNNIRFDLFVSGIYEDNLFVLKYLDHCSSVSYIDSVVYYYRKVENSNSRGYKKNTLEINRRIFKRIHEYILHQKRQDREKYVKAFYIYVIRRLAVSLDTFYFAKDNRTALIKKLKGLHCLLRKEPYNSAIDHVEFRLLNRYERLIWFTARTRSACMLWIVVHFTYILVGLFKR